MTIAIIGGGFSGTLTAVHLLRTVGYRGRVVLINRSGAMARGVAYGTQSDHHVLNVPAGRMSAFEDDPDSFVRFVREHGTPVDGGAFVSRHLYGAYLESLLQAAAEHATAHRAAADRSTADRATADRGTAGRAAADRKADRAEDVVLERVAAEVLTISPAPDGTHAWIDLSDGSRLRADRVVLAVGNYPPLNPSVLDDREGSAARFFATSRRYVADPWKPGALTAAADPRWPTLLVGTGLTMIDIAVELRALGAGDVGYAVRAERPDLANPAGTGASERSVSSAADADRAAPAIADVRERVAGRCVAISRRGLLPVAHRGASHPPDRSEVPPALADPSAATPTARAYLRIVRHHVRDAALRGVDWRDVIAALRPLTPRLWQALPLVERRRFLRHVRPFWEVHRHRVAPALHEAFTAMRDAGHLRLLAGRLVSIREEDDRVIVRIQPRGAGAARADRDPLAQMPPVQALRPPQAPVDLTVGLVVNCTGPAADTRRLRDALFERLQADGLLRVDPLGLGIETTADGAVIGADGRVVPALYYVGPFLKARAWEATAVPELREYARALAAHLVETLAPAPAAALRSAPSP